MARVRSPNYPQISLPEAIRRVERIRHKEGRNAASREALAKLLGFGGLNGASVGILSAISKYGLLEEVGDKELRVSDLADAILYPQDACEKAKAISEAAKKPALFSEISEKWPDRVPSTENLNSYLMRRGFSHSALNNAIACYRETMELVTSNGEAYDGADEGTGREISPMPPRPPQQPRETYETILAPTPGEPYRVSFAPSGIEVYGRLTTPEEADALIRAIEALKLLLQPTRDKGLPQRELEYERT